MKTYYHFQKLCVLGILVLSGFLFLEVDMDTLYGVSVVKEPLLNEGMLQYQIKGTVRDVSNNTPIQNAKISLLDPSTRDVLYSDIYTDVSGAYHTTLEIEPTDIWDIRQELPSEYWISKPSPNPVSPSETNTITIQYVTPDNRNITPVLETYNILGKKVDHRAHLAQGVYLYRLNFKNGHFSETKKMVLISGGQLHISLKQIVPDSKQQLGKKVSPPHNGTVMNDSMEVLYVIEKSGYAYLKQLKDLVAGADNVHDFTLVQSSEEISTVIDSLGGTVEHSGGLIVEFPEGAFSSPVTVTVSKTDLPGPLPSDVTQASSVFSISTSGKQPQYCAKVSFTGASQSQSEEYLLGIYRWNWEEWQYIGGYTAGDTVYTYMRDFSTFLAGTADSKIYRLFRFENIGTRDAFVYVWNYRLLHPDWDVPITQNLGVPCYAEEFEPIEGNFGWYPQGYYQFCADWWEMTYGFRHRYIGNGPPRWTYFVGEYSSLVIPPVVYVDTRITGSLEGPCPCQINQVFPIATGIEGNWSGTLPPPWGPTTLFITVGYWVSNNQTGTSTHPVIFVSTQDQYVIIWDYDDQAYQKIEWSIINDNNITFTIYDTHPTFDEADNDTDPEIVDVLFTKTGE